MRKKKKYSKTPSNLSFWTFTLKNPKETEQFILRGNKKQKDDLIHVLLYYKRFDIDFFKEIKGQAIIKKLKEK